jgi:hypothetical protein
LIKGRLGVNDSVFGARTEKGGRFPHGLVLARMELQFAGQSGGFGIANKFAGGEDAFLLDGFLDGQGGLLVFWLREEG